MMWPLAVAPSCSSATTCRPFRSCATAACFLAGLGRVCGGVKEMIELYLSRFSKTMGSDEFPDRRPGSGEYRYTSASPAREYFGGGEEKAVNFEIQRRSKLVGRTWFSAHLVNPAGTVVMQCDSRLTGTWIEDRERVAGQFWFTTPWLKPGTYRVDLFICTAGALVDDWEGACSLTISPVLPYLKSATEDVTAHGVVFADFAWRQMN